MRVLILGAGALGSLLGARLAQVTETCLLSRNRKHIRAIREQGLTVEELDGSQSRFSLPALADPSELAEGPDLVVIAVKSYDTASAVESVLSVCRPDTLFLGLQNGLGNLEQIISAGLEGRVLAGTTAQGATLVQPGRIRHGGQGPTNIGEPEGPASGRVLKVVNLFRKAGLESHSSDQARLLIWRKLIVNVGINPLSAICLIKNGWIADQPQAAELCKAAVEEAVYVARACGIDPGGNMPEAVLEIARSTAGNISSMHQDVRSGKRTEIDSINGAVVRLGRELGLDTPVNRTLTNLIRLIEQRNEQEERHG